MGGSRLEVRRTVDFDRIAALPRRVVSMTDAEAWADALTPELAARPGVRLLPAQALALAEGCALDDAPRQSAAPGAFLGYPVGTGKTLIFELAPRLLQAKRPVLILPSGLREKTYHERSSYAEDWRIAAPRVLGMRELMLEANDRMLDVIRPDWIGIDECDELANPEASVTARIDRYVSENWDEVSVWAATGTPGRNSILDYWHVLHWCVKDDAPVPRDYAEAQLWAQSVDNRVVGRRPEPGALGPDLQSARTWYRKRLCETPGVIMWDEDSAGGVPLHVRAMPARECPDIDAAFEALGKTGENPAGIPSATPLDQFRFELQTGSGLCQYWDPPPPEEWRDARRAVAAFCRRAIMNSRMGSRPIDTERQVLRRFADSPVVREWLSVKPRYRPEEHTKVMWISDSALQSAIDWLEATRAAGRVGIVWTGIVEFGRELAQRTGLSYYGQQGRDQYGGRILTADPGSCMIVSHAGGNKRGLNLQSWRHQLVCQVPTSGKYVEQTFGRAHRRGASDRGVHIDCLMTSGLVYDSFERAMSEAGFGQATYGLTQKLVRAAQIERHYPKTDRTSPNRYRWARGEDRYDPAAYGLTTS